MNYREVILHANETLGSSGTKLIDINVTEPITELLLNWRCGNDSTILDNTPPQESLDKVEIVDGGQVYMSLTGSEAIAVAAYEMGKYPPHWFTAQASAGQSVLIPIRFGRFIGDTEYALNPKALLNPQLRITWSNESGVIATGTQLEVLATVMQGIVSPTKALFTRAIESWTTGSGVHECDLPVDRAYRRLFARQYYDTAWLGYMWSQFKLDCDLGKLIVFNWDDVQFTRYVEARFPEFEVHDWPFVTSGDYKNTVLGNVNEATAQGTASGYTQAAVSPNTPHYMQIFLRNQDGVAATNQKVFFVTRGSCPEFTYCYQFGEAEKPETWFNARQFNGIKLNITEAEAGGTASVLLQQPASLP